AAGRLVLLVVPTNVNQILRLMQSNGRQRAEIHPERPVAVEDEDFALRDKQLVFHQGRNDLQTFKAFHINPAHNTARVSNKATGRFELFAAITAPAMSCFTLAGSRITVYLIPNP